MKRAEDTSSIWLDIKQYIPLDKFYNLINQVLIVNIITMFLMTSTSVFGTPHIVGISFCYTTMFVGFFTILTFLASKSDDQQKHNFYKLQNARSHLALLIVAYTSLLIDNYLYFEDQSNYCSKKTTVEDCNNKMLGLWLLDIVLFIFMLTWMSACKSLFEHCEQD